MGYSNYKQIKSVIKRFNLDMRLIRLFDENLEVVAPVSWLLETLEMAKGTSITNEKSKSERIVSPILLEASKSYTDQISFFSGESLNIKPEDDLSGECDFFFALHPPKLYIDAPIISLAEAKDEDME